MNLLEYADLNQVASKMYQKYIEPLMNLFYLLGHGFIAIITLKTILTI